jgi:phosphoribosyl-dephospho-CoA transferase
MRTALAPVCLDDPTPHDLLWIRQLQDLVSETPLPAWAWGQAATPVVVRRERTADSSLIPVGLRGRTRSERHAAYLPRGRVLLRLVPEQLAQTRAWTRFPQFADFSCVGALAGLAPSLDAAGLTWGITGSVGFALATGIPVMRPHSDLDLLLRVARPMPRHDATKLVATLRIFPVRIDVQVDTSRGAFALSEWASGRPRVLLKTDDGPVLVDDPWQ